MNSDNTTPITMDQFNNFIQNDLRLLDVKFTSKEDREVAMDEYCFLHDENGVSRFPTEINIARTDKTTATTTVNVVPTDPESLPMREANAIRKFVQRYPTQERLKMFDSHPNNLEINAAIGRREIVVLPRGWIVVGNVLREGQEIVVRNGSMLRRWGTTRGLSQLALTGPTEDTILDPCADVVCDSLAVVARIVVNVDPKTNKYLI
jgi:hypothetical protein